MRAVNILMEIVETLCLSKTEILTFWTVNFIGTALSAMIGAKLSIDYCERQKIITYWISFGIFSSLFLYVSSKELIYLTSGLLGASFGFGMPTSMAYYAGCTTPENRSKLGGFTFFIIAFCTFLFSVKTVDILVNILLLIILRALSLMVFLINNFCGENVTIKQPPYSFVVSQRSFILYFLPWFMFCLVNYTTAPVMFKFFGKEFFSFLMTIEGVLIGTFAVLSGFVSDVFGRKRIVIIGFVMIGLGYAFLGVFPESQLACFLYTVTDGIAWGMFHTIFVMTIWGDLAQNNPSEKFYAMGGIPYLLSHFLQIVIGSYIAGTVSANSIFSFASLFLFLAVVPLMFAPETLPERVLRERELRSYVERAKRVREKFTKS